MADGPWDDPEKLEQVALGCALASAYLHRDGAGLLALLGGEPVSSEVDEAIAAMAAVIGVLVCNTSDCDPDDFGGDGHAAAAACLRAWCSELSLEGA